MHDWPENEKIKFNPIFANDDDDDDDCYNNDDDKDEMWKTFTSKCLI